MKNFKMALAAGMIAATSVWSGQVLAQDMEAGEAAFRKCAVCHSNVEGQNKIGPSLFGVVGRIPGTTDYKYSNAMKAFGEDGNVWDEATLDVYLENPRVVVPGTRMSFPGAKDDAERAALIAYLKTLTTE